jgi:hypothetical protein
MCALMLLLDRWGQTGRWRGAGQVGKGRAGAAPDGLVNGALPSAVPDQRCGTVLYYETEVACLNKLSLIKSNIFIVSSKLFHMVEKGAARCT